MRWRLAAWSINAWTFDKFEPVAFLIVAFSCSLIARLRTVLLIICLKDFLADFVIGIATV